jgi:hypothetical protein
MIKSGRIIWRLINYAREGGGGVRGIKQISNL